MFIIKRSEDNPIISPIREHSWEAAAAFNWSPVYDGKGILHVLYRALSERQLLEEPRIHRSIIAHAQSADGTKFTDRLPFIVPQHEWERYGCEDPRITYIDGKYFIFYTALGTYPFSADGIRVAVAISKDMKTIQEKHLVTPFNAKAFVLFPEKINNQYVVLLTANTDRPPTPTQIAIAYLDKIEQLWSEEFWNNWYANLDEHVIHLRRGEDEQVEVGAVPVRTEHGWLLIYSHAGNYHTENDKTWGIEAILLDLQNPQMVLGRTKGSFLSPEAFYEKTGLMRNIVFPSGAMVNGANLDIYYGGADTHCCRASVNLENLIESMLPGSTSVFTRCAENPILTSRASVEWESDGVMNPAALEIEGTIYLVYRAVAHNNYSTFGLATTLDGVHINKRYPKPIYTPRIDEERCGVEDPRLGIINDEIFMTYTAWDGATPRIALARISIPDFVAHKWDKWTMPVLITQPDVPNKDACIIPEKTKLGYVLFHRVSESVCADVLHTLDFKDELITKCIEIIYPRPGMWDARKVGAATPPIKTKYGWLLFYHGISMTGTYRVGAVLLDLKDPTMVLSRTAIPLFQPEADYEVKGVVPKVVFPCGVIIRKDTIYMYYGGGDAVVGVATASLSEILTKMI